MIKDRSRSAVFFIQYAALLLYSLVWVRFDHVSRYVGDQIRIFYAVIFIALCYVAVRAHIVFRDDRATRWETGTVAIDLLLITIVVRLTGRINSEAALVYFWPIATSAIQRQPRRVMAVGMATLLLYIPASWPEVMTGDYVERLVTRIFVLALVTVLAAAYVRHELARVEEMARLREKVALAEYRSRLSQEMHDGIQRYLVSIAVRLEMAGKLIRQDPARAARIAVDQQVPVRQAADELRYLVRRLRSPVVERQGFVDALKEHLALFAERSDVSCPVTIEGSPVELPPEIEQAAFRIFQEALTNIEKHAQATEVKVTLKFGDALLECVIADNGVGFDPAALPAGPSIEGGFGMPSMRQRAEAVGGELQITGAPGQGTRVAFTMPVRDEDASPQEAT